MTDNDRDSPDVMIGRIDERVKFIVESLPKLATVEAVARVSDHVDTVETNLKSHIESGRWTIGNWIAVACCVATVGMALAAWLR